VRGLLAGQHGREPGENVPAADGVRELDPFEQALAHGHGPQPPHRLQPVLHGLVRPFHRIGSLTSRAVQARLVMGRRLACLPAHAALAAAIIPKPLPLQALLAALEAAA
jgi:hypothetical protein